MGLESGSGPEMAPEEIEDTTPPVQPRGRGLFGRLNIFRHRQAHESEPNSQEEMPTPPVDEMIADIQEGRREQSQAQAESLRLERNVNPERLKTPNTPEDLVNLMLVMDGVDWRERKLDEKYKGGRLGAIRKFMAGERDFTLDQNGQTQREAWNEFKRKALKVGISTAISTTAAVGIGVATGGVGLLAFGAVFGSTLAHSAVEAMHSLSGKERGLREDIARGQWEQWAEMHQDAIDSTTETDPQKKHELLENIIDVHYQSSEKIAGFERAAAAENKLWNKRRLIGKLVGGLAGAGITFGLAHLGERVMTMDIDGDKITHIVERVNDTWHSVYNNQQQAAEWAKSGLENLKGIITDPTGRYVHELGESTAQVVWGVTKNLAPAAGVLMGAVFQRGWEKLFSEPSEEKMDQERAEQDKYNEERKEYFKKQLPAVPGGGAETVAGPGTESNIPSQYVELATELGKGLPEVGKTWIYQDVGGLGIIKIKSIDWERGQAKVNLLDRGFQSTGEEHELGLDKLITKGTEKSEFVNNWLLTVPEGGKVRISPDLKIFDRSDPRGQRIIPAEDYGLRRIKEKPSQAELVKENQEKQRVNIFDLAFWGVRPLETEKKVEEKIKAPKPKDVWAKRKDAGDLPPEFQGMQDKITITEVEDGVVYFKDGDRPIEDIKLFVKYYGKVGGGGGEGPKEKKNK